VECLLHSSRAKRSRRSGSCAIIRKRRGHWCVADAQRYPLFSCRIIGYGRRGDRSPRLRFKTGRAAFTAPGSSAPRPLVWAALLAKPLEDFPFAAWTRVLSLPLGRLRRLWAYEPLLTPPHSEDRPHVSISEALPSALASWGIPSTLSSGWYLLRRETTSVTSFPPPVCRCP
jgi:hypothetical protein